MNDKKPTAPDVCEKHREPKRRLTESFRGKKFVRYACDKCDAEALARMSRK